MTGMKPNGDSSSDEQRDKNCVRGSANQALKWKLPSPPEDLESITVIKKRRYSADDVASFLGREPSLAGKKCLEKKFETMPQGARKRPASPPSASESWRQYGNKKKRLSDDNDASHDSRTLSLCESNSDDEERPDGHRNSAKKRSCSLVSDCNESLRQSKKLKQTTVTSHKENKVRKIHRQKIIDGLKDMGVRIFEQQEVRVMTTALHVVIGSGVYGSCIKTVEPDTQQQLVIKTFFDRDLNDLINETENLVQLQMEGVQRLVGVCVDDCQIISHFAGIVLYKYFNNPVPLPDAATIFLQLARTCRRVLEKGFTHQDLHEGNVCVLNRSSGPVATLIDFGLATDLDGDNSNEIFRLGLMMDELLKPDKVCIQHPLVAALITWMEAAIRVDPAERLSLASLEAILELILEEASKAKPPGSTSGTDEKLVLKRRRELESSNTVRKGTSMPHKD